MTTPHTSLLSADQLVAGTTYSAVFASVSGECNATFRGRFGGSLLFRCEDGRDWSFGVAYFRSAEAVA